LIVDWPFKVIDKGGKPVISVQYKGETKEFTPEEICKYYLFSFNFTLDFFSSQNAKFFFTTASMVLLGLKATAEGYLATPITNAGKFTLS